MQAAEKWIDEIYKQMGDEEWEALADGGYDGEFLDAIRAVFHNRYMCGDNRYSNSFYMWRDAIFAYAFKLGREVERKAAT